jgi:hypothetical protein
MMQPYKDMERLVFTDCSLDVFISDLPVAVQVYLTSQLCAVKAVKRRSSIEVKQNRAGSYNMSIAGDAANGIAAVCGVVSSPADEGNANTRTASFWMIDNDPRDGDDGAGGGGRRSRRSAAAAGSAQMLGITLDEAEQAIEHVAIALALKAKRAAAAAAKSSKGHKGGGQKGATTGGKQGDKQGGNKGGKKCGKGKKAAKASLDFTESVGALAEHKSLLDGESDADMPIYEVDEDEYSKIVQQEQQQEQQQQHSKMKGQCVLLLLQH